MSASSVARTGFFQAFKRSRFHVGPRTLKSQGVSIEGVQPVYDCGKLAWWARWTYFLVAADLVVTASACELTWNHWTTWEELPKESVQADTHPISRRPASMSTSVDVAASNEVVGHYVPRPWWQRGLFTMTNFITGVGLAAILLGGRSRIVRKLFIIPSPATHSQKATNNQRLLVVQSPLHPRNHGAVYPLHRTQLLPSSDQTEMLLTMDDARGHYSIGLGRASVGGKQLPTWDARKALFTVWYGEKEGTQRFLNSLQVKG